MIIFNIRKPWFLRDWITKPYRVFMKMTLISCFVFSSFLVYLTDYLFSVMHAIIIILANSKLSRTTEFWSRVGMIPDRARSQPTLRNLLSKDFGYQSCICICNIVSGWGKQWMETVPYLEGIIYNIHVVRGWGRSPKSPGMSSLSKFSYCFTKYRSLPSVVSISTDT